MISFVSWTPDHDSLLSLNLIFPILRIQNPGPITQNPTISEPEAGVGADSATGSVGMIVIFVGCALVAAAMIGFLLWWYRQNRKKPKDDKYAEAETNSWSSSKVADVEEPREDAGDVAGGSHADRSNSQVGGGAHVPPCIHRMRSRF